MAERASRRTILKRGTAAAAGLCLTDRISMGAEVASQPSSEAANRLSGYAFGGRCWVHIDDRPFVCYRAEPGQKYPYFYPIAGPATGLPMTTESGVPWPHHRSLLFGCDKVNGNNFWQEGLERGRIVSRGPTVKMSPAGSAVIEDRCDWQSAQGTPVFEDVRRFILTTPSSRLRILDAEITLTARTEVRINKTNHSFFALRAAADLTPSGGGRLINSAGQEGEKATFGQPARWCGFEGRRLGVSESIVLMDHPGNPWQPCPWFTRDYGFISPTGLFWLDEGGWRLAEGAKVKLRYRVVVAAGPIEPAEMDSLHARFAVPAASA